MYKTAQNDLAKRLKSLHVSGKPVLLANVHDAYTAKLVASNPATQAIATASYSIAMTHGVGDHDLTLEQNLESIRNVVAGLKNSGRQDEVPLSADLQDGYADPAETITRAVKAGVVGCNIEDLDNTAQPPRLRSIEDAAGRIRAVLAAAKAAGVPDFAVNARTDVFGFGGTVDDVVERGKAFLDAGATTVFVWGVGKKVITKEEVVEMVDRLGGKLAVQPGGLEIAELRKCGVSRISVGPTVFLAGMKAFGEAADKIVTA